MTSAKRWLRHVPLVTRLLRPRSIRRGLALLPAVFGAKGRPVEIHVPGIATPLALRARTSDVLVAVQILLLDELDVPALRAPQLIVDAGANIGLSAITLASRWPDATIVCLEIDDANLELLRRNTRAWPQIRIVPKGLWRHAARLRVANEAAASWAFRVVEDPAGPIPGIGVGELLAELGRERIDLMKVDIEGAEHEVFDTDDGAWLARVDTLLVELHEDLRPGSSEGVRRRLREAGFSLRASGEYVIATRDA
ncbi:MAG TPA: FkbM family methyltransferase [Gemmatimonadales bacterium]|nr:FkbM family methyltransferase [Gemmatimonadales bacterium]